jgi:hypothetical protein
LAKLFAEHRGHRNIAALPPLSVRQIIAWAKAHYRRTRTWPTKKSGPITEAPGETWSGVDHALYVGYRSLPGVSSLSRLLARHCGVRNRKDRCASFDSRLEEPRFSIENH